MTSSDDSGSSEQSRNNDLQILSTLLVKERPVESSTEIKAILASKTELKEKIRLIQNFDDILKKNSDLIGTPGSNQSPKKTEIMTALSNLQKKTVTKTRNSEKKEEDSASLNYLSKPGIKSASIKPESNFAVDSIALEAAKEVENHRHNISLNRKKLKALIRPSSFFKYLFSQRKKIRTFGDETLILRIKYFSTKILLNPLVLKVFPKNIDMITGELVKSLENVLESGWYYLEKRDYNLVVVLYKLCNKLSKINFKEFNPKSPYLIDRMEEVELLFLILNNKPGDVKEVIYAVDTVFNKDPSNRKLQHSTSVNIHKLLDKDQLKPSLYNLIIGLNIMKTKTFLKLESLQNHSHQLIDSHDYNCTPKIRKKIDEYLRNLEKGIPSYLEHEKEVYRLHAFIPTNEKGGIDYPNLQTFYNTFFVSSNLSFSANKDNIIKFILNLGNAFILSFREILSEMVELENGKKKRLFRQTIFGQDVDRIDFNLGKLDKIQTILPNFPTSRCLSIKKNILGAKTSEADATQIIFEITNTMFAIGKRLAHILRCAIPQSSEDINKIEIPFFSFDEITYNIPYENHKISHSGYLHGLSVREALIQVTGVCYQVGAFTQHNEISDLLAKEKQAHYEIRVKTKQYNQIAHEKVYAYFVKKYNLTL